MSDDKRAFNNYLTSTKERRALVGKIEAISLHRYYSIAFNGFNGGNLCLRSEMHQTEDVKTRIREMALPYKVEFLVERMPVEWKNIEEQ
jgi:hypothetical protein